MRGDPHECAVLPHSGSQLPAAGHLVLVLSAAGLHLSRAADLLPHDFGGQEQEL